jgi:predicted branched-subunit amino acid permease
MSDALAVAPARRHAHVSGGVRRGDRPARRPVPSRTSVAMRSGARAMMPMIVGYAPFALLVGAAVAESDQPWAAWLATWTIYGGAAHLAVLDVLGSGAGVLGAVLVGLMVNVRLAAYSASMAPDWRSVSTVRRALAALALTDAPWALAQDAPGGARARRARYAGAALVLWFAWPLLVTCGALLGHVLQDLPAANLLPGLTLGVLVVPHLRHRPGLAAATTAAVTAVACSPLPAGPALLASAAAGALAGAAAHRSAS